MNNNIGIIDKKNCYGCSTCEQICPKGSIFMKYDNEGFLYPSIDETCVNCGKCFSICPARNDINIDGIYNEPNCYGAYVTNDELRYNSSSGGVFSLLSDYILKKKGVIYGAIYDFNLMKVIHSSSENTSVTNMKKSKYVQSDTLETYKECKHNLEQGKQVLYSGTPCQIAGLYNFLQRDYTNLYTVDIICHGVPSPRVFTTYFTLLEKNKGKIINIDFRTKLKGWGSWTQFFINTVINNTQYNKHALLNFYYVLFLSNISLRKSCYSCRFTTIHRKSDITLGDFWGINKVISHMNDGKGTSLVLLNSKKGQSIFEEISSDLVFEKADINRSLQQNLVRPSKKPLFRDSFFIFYNKYNFHMVKMIFYPIALATIFFDKLRGINNKHNKF